MDDVRLISGIIKVEADIRKTNSNTCFIIHWFEKITTSSSSHGRKFDIALANQCALFARPSDLSAIG